MVLSRRDGREALRVGMKDKNTSTVHGAIITRFASFHFISLLSIYPAFADLLFATHYYDIHQVLTVLAYLYPTLPCPALPCPVRHLPYLRSHYITYLCTQGARYSYLQKAPNVPYLLASRTSRYSCVIYYIVPESVRRQTVIAHRPVRQALRCEIKFYAAVSNENS